MISTTDKARHLVIRMDRGVLPDDLITMLRDEVVTCGWIRASGVLEHVEITSFDGATRGPSPTRRIAGPVHVLSLDGSIGLTDGDVTCGLRGLFARESDNGLETFAGEVMSARIVALEAMVTALDDVAIARTRDAKTGAWLFSDGKSSTASSAPQEAARPAPKPQPPSAWAEVAASSDEARYSPPKAPGSGPSLSAQIPQRPARPQAAAVEDMVLPEAGDLVEHFAFGVCEVVKSDGDRLFLKLGKDGRIKEIAVEMLKVTPLESEGPGRLFKLARRL